MRQFAVIGLGRFGTKVALTLSELGMPVIAIDNNPRRIELIADKVAFALKADATDKKALGMAGVSSADVAVVSLGEQLEASVLVTIILREIGVEQIIVKGTSPEHGKILELVGATQVVFPEEDIARRVAQKIIAPNIVDHIPLLPGYSIIEFIAPEQFLGKTLLDLNMRRNFGVEVLVIKRGEITKVIPSAMDKIQENDTLVILGKDEDVQKVRSIE
ncbi:TrkA family potassium uptake protein [bacterium]|nr:TrkA family potassium uptake protein [bacterium]